MQQFEFQIEHFLKVRIHIQSKKPFASDSFKVNSMSRVFNFAGLSWLQENNYSIVAFDCFGCGSSPKPKDPSAYSHAEMFAGALTLPDHRSFADYAWQPLHFPASLPPDHEPEPFHNPIQLIPIFTATASCPALGT